jgi:hypothetical protein
MKKKFVFILMLMLGSMTFFYAQKSYINNWFFDSDNWQIFDKPGKSILNNFTMFDTVYDTASLSFISDIEYVYVKALGIAGSYYCSDVHILEDGSVIIPWYDFNGEGFHITKIDSMGNEVYTNDYSNIDGADLKCYRDGDYLYMPGNYDLDSVSIQYRFLGLLKYDLVSNDTVSFKVIRALPRYSYYDATFLQIDSLFYVSPNWNLEDDYLYVINKNGVVLDSILAVTSVRKIFENRDSIYVINSRGNIYNIANGTMDFVQKLNCYGPGAFYNNEDFIVVPDSHNDRIVKYNNDFSVNWISYTNTPIMSGSPRGTIITKDSCILGAWGYIEENSGGLFPSSVLALYKLNMEGHWLHKLYIAPTDLYDQRVYEFSNRDYFVIARANENPTGNGTIFLMRMKPWQDNVGIHNHNISLEIDITPNPTYELINIIPSEMFQNSVVSIFNATGKLQVRENLYGSSISVVGLPSGIYLLNIDKGGLVYKSKFIKY